MKDMEIDLQGLDAALKYSVCQFGDEENGVTIETVIGRMERRISDAGSTISRSTKKQQSAYWDWFRAGVEELKNMSNNT